MKNNNNWIKYLAIAFGLVLSLGIISLIVNGGISVIKSFGLIGEENQQTKQQTTPYIQLYTGDLDAIYVNLNVGSVTLQTGDVFKVEGTNLPKNLDVTFEQGKLSIEDDRFLFNFIHPSQKPRLSITIPEDTSLKILELDLGAGQGKLSQISAQKLIVKQGAGELVANNLKADSGQLEGGAGAVHFSDVQLHDFDIDGGVGLIDIQGIISGNMKLNCGIGQTKLAISGPVDDYYINADPGLGTITVNDRKISENGFGSKSAPNYIDIDGGIGMVNLTIN
ncbi:DUF4097 family beta strand repeat-containing protein [Acetobacterium woodii]|uniref:DUF4097 domain-containing protein n=1 Tax=Acetobacterium woodii (strain ATCC 29683 / DSM 1030 / JCM 2381 / KCTC 1655 / WB1) TaxID=931626 RepID=H6LHZ3_ACEWD|nr:DUF4097 family beta strand repeat-containing protein [Acetobacterium woodii]AFA48523.1 hypothetical protein Awo_c17430 [Acetobacterium woodii DSM 1030]